MTTSGAGDWSAADDVPRPRPEWSSEPAIGVLSWEGPPPAPPAADYLHVRRVGPYPMRYDLPYPGELDRASTIFRPIVALPVLAAAVIALAFVLAGMTIGWVAVFARRSYPAWLFTGVSGGLAWLARASAYFALLSDRWPSFDPHESPVSLQYQEPSPALSRWRVLVWKAVVLLPHFALLAILTVVSLLAVVAAWFAIVGTGRYPRSLFHLVTGVQRWRYRVIGYFASFTDRFPPYTMAADAGPATYAGTALSGILGLLMAGVLVGAAATVAVQTREPPRVAISYADLRAGRTMPPATFFTGPPAAPSFAVTLRSVSEDDQRYSRLLNLSPAERVVVFNLQFTNRTGRDVMAGPQVLRLTYDAAGSVSTITPVLLFVDGEVAPRLLHHEALTPVSGVFLLPANAVPRKLRVDPPWAAATGGVYVFE
jgi:hypothetical protein